MTTAHRPTWAPAKGNDEQGGYRVFVSSAAVSARDLPGHTKLKFRSFRQRFRRRSIFSELKDKILKLTSNDVI